MRGRARGRKGTLVAYSSGEPDSVKSRKLLSVQKRQAQWGEIQEGPNRIQSMRTVKRVHRFRKELLEWKRQVQ